MKDSHAVLIEELTRLRAERNAPTRREADLERALRWALRELDEFVDPSNYPEWPAACDLCGIDASTGKAVK
jgi:hypothetical protein